MHDTERIPFRSRPRSPPLAHIMQERAQNMIVPSTPSTANEMLPRSLAPHEPMPGIEGAAEGSASPDTSEQPERMSFQLNPGEEEEASSFVPLSIAGNRAGRPVKWSLGYLGENAKEESGMIVGGGSFGETKNTKTGRSWCVTELLLLFSFCLFNPRMVYMIRRCSALRRIG